MTVTTFEIAAATDDGSGYKTGAGYPPDSAYVVEDGATCWAVKSATNNEVDTSYVRWDTSSLSGQTISAAAVRIYISAISDADARNLVCDYYDFGGEASVDGDWTASVGTGAFSIDITSLAASDWNEISLTDPDTNISKAGYTGLRFGVSGGSATGANSVAIVGYENDPAFAPELKVTHSAATSTGANMLLLGVG